MILMIETCQSCPHFSSDRDGAECDRLQAAEAAESVLHGSSYTALRRIRCSCDHGNLTLEGELPSHYLKQVAQTLVAGNRNFNRLLNRIAVVGEK